MFLSKKSISEDLNIFLDYQSLVVDVVLFVLEILDEELDVSK
jgi:hypothetical protein